MKEFDNLQSFLEHVALATSIDQDWEGAKINLMTMHASKGLEFDVVFLSAGKNLLQIPTLWLHALSSDLSLLLPILDQLK